MLFGPKMAETSSSGPPLAHACFGPLELVSAIFIEIKLHYFTIVVRLSYFLTDRWLVFSLMFYPQYRRWCFFGPNLKGPNTQKGRKQLGRMLFGPALARARFGPLELVSAIFIEVECHSVLHSSGHKLGLAEVLIFTSCMVKYNFYFVSW